MGFRGFIKLASSYPVRKLRCTYLKQRYGFNCTFEGNASLLKVNIELGNNSKLNVKGTLQFTSFFYNYTPINIILRDNATLQIDGDLIASGASIIDSIFHYLAYDGVPADLQADVVIGNRVWLCPDVAVLKGSVIGDGCIVGHKSVVTGKSFPECCFIAGAPAKVIKTNCDWRSTLT